VGVHRDGPGQPAPDLRACPLRLVFAGTPEPALPPLRALLASRHEVVAVVTRPDAPAGRGRHERRSPVAVLAAEAGVPVLTPGRPREPEFLAALAALRPDCCPVVAYGALVPRVALDIPKHGWVNLHFSLLPAWRGAAPVQHAIRAGDEVTGATTFRIVEELDAGPTFGVMTERIRPTDTAGDLLQRLATGGAELLVRTLDGIEDGTLEAREQPTDGVSLAPKIDVDDGRVDWSRPAAAVDRLVRASTPAPGAWSTYDEGRVKLGPVRLADDLPGLPAGELEVTKQAVFVGTGTHPVRLGDVQPVGKKPMPAADWARGVRVQTGATLR
jgi:methionyl-tRNA formyltransferase